MFKIKRAKREKRLLFNVTLKSRQENVMIG